MSKAFFVVTSAFLSDRPNPYIAATFGSLSVVAFLNRDYSCMYCAKVVLRIPWFSKHWRVKVSSIYADSSSRNRSSALNETIWWSWSIWFQSGSLRSLVGHVRYRLRWWTSFFMSAKVVIASIVRPTTFSYKDSKSDPASDGESIFLHSSRTSLVTRCLDYLYIQANTV